MVASWDTGIVLDVGLKNKFCSVCSARCQMDETSQEFMDWWEVHQSRVWMQLHRFFIRDGV